MAKRIPHTDLEIITGEDVTRNYLEMQKKMGKFYLRNFLDILYGLDREGKYLEIGPGPGYQTSLVARHKENVQITALEYSKDMVSLGKDYIVSKRLDKKVTYLHGSVEEEDLMAGLGKFDVVYSTFSLHHWPDPERGFRNCINALKDDGVLCVYDFVRKGILYYLPVKRGIWESVRASYTPDEIRRILEGLGINDFEITTRYPYLSIIVRK